MQSVDRLRTSCSDVICYHVLGDGHWPRHGARHDRHNVCLILNRYLQAPGRGFNGSKRKALHPLASGCSRWEHRHTGVEEAVCQVVRCSTAVSAGPVQPISRQYANVAVKSTGHDTLHPAQHVILKDTVCMC